APRTSPAAPVAPTAPAPATSQAPAPAPSKSATPAPRPPLDGHSAEEAAVVELVNQERALAGCGPVRANPPLATLAGAFSLDMATRGFFSHEDPEGNSPWDRATKAGIAGLGGENIARGQGDAEAVMKAWMNSPDHKANILNCEFRTLGVGVHVAAGGPWWTQDFGF
ncbi:CAP domain-containing protein, partial [Streptomyces sp. SID1046]|uniref:CAP domain-containing protein n=1 Tax=Streptomyces sp. SID1046 TaxID=2690249 RepID=UPI0013939CDE